jgi:hypothetical protein
MYFVCLSVSFRPHSVTISLISLSSASPFFILFLRGREEKEGAERAKDQKCDQCQRKGPVTIMFVDLFGYAHSSIPYFLDHPFSLFLSSLVKGREREEQKMRGKMEKIR